MLPYLVVRARWTAFTLLAACSFDGSGLVSVGEPTSTSTTTGDTTTTTAPSTTTVLPTTAGPGSDSDSATMSTTAPVDPTVDPSTTTTTTGPDTTTTTGPDTTTSTGPDTTDTSSTTSTDTSTSTGPDTTTGPMCVDTGTEPNENEAQSVDLGDQHCKDDAESFTGVLDGSGDVDWFRFFGDFSGWSCNDNDPDPTASITVTADDTLEVCMFADCEGDNETLFTCPNGTTQSLSLENRKGCCGPGSMSFVVNCQDGGDESAMMYVRLQKAPADACVAYKVDYSYHN